MSEENGSVADWMSWMTAKARELAEQQGKTQGESAVFVLHNKVTGRIYIGQPRPAGPEPEAGE